MKQTTYSREGAAERGYDERWRKWRGGFIKRNPLCVRCFAVGRFVPATVADHYVPGRTGIAWFGHGPSDWSAFERGGVTNGQRIVPVCHTCHNTKRGEELQAEKEFPGTLNVKSINASVYCGLAIDGVPIDGAELLRTFDGRYRQLVTG